MTGPFELYSAGDLDFLICPSLAERGLPHGFTFRWRRVQKEREGAPVAFGLPSQERSDLRDLSRALGLELVDMRQVHGDEIEVISQPPLEPPVCDGLLTDREGVGLTVRTADCVPLLLWDERNNVAAAVHAGWRGTLAGVASRAIDTFRRRFDSRAVEIHAAMGPSIGPCCYEVGEEVVRSFAEQISGANDLFAGGPGGKKNLDLIEANRRQLVSSGVPLKQVYSSGLCTRCSNELFYSYRKEGKGVGRLLGVVGVVGGLGGSAFDRKGGRARPKGI